MHKSLKHLSVCTLSLIIFLSPILMLVALLLCVCPCTPVEEGGYGHGRHVWIRHLILLVWSDFLLAWRAAGMCVRVLRMASNDLDLVWHYQYDCCWTWDILSDLWLIIGHGGEGALTNTSLGWCVCARVLCVCVCIVLTNVWPGGFWCALTLSTVVIKTAALQRRRWLHYLQWSLTYMSFFQRGHPICFCGDGVSRGQWKLMELLSNSCWCSSSSLPVCLSIGGLGCVQMEKKKIVWILFPGWHYSIASLKLKKKMLS